MKHRILFRFRIVRNDRIYEVYFDDRLSFDDNFRLLRNILNELNDGLEIFDPVKKVFLNKSVPIRKFCFAEFIQLLVFD